MGGTGALCASKVLHSSPRRPRCQKHQNKRRHKIPASFWAKTEDGEKHKPSPPPHHPTRVIFRPLLHFLSHSSSLPFTLSLSGILAAILVLGSHLSFGGSCAFLLADGTPTHTHTHTQKQTHMLVKLPLPLSASLSLRGLKDKKTYRGYAGRMEGGRRSGRSVCSPASAVSSAGTASCAQTAPV